MRGRHAQTQRGSRPNLHDRPVHPQKSIGVVPTPTIDPTMMCVVDTGKPALVANATHPAAPRMIAVAAAKVGTIPLDKSPFPKVPTIAPASSAPAKPPNPVHTVQGYCDFQKVGKCSTAIYRFDENERDGARVPRYSRCDSDRGDTG